MNNCNNKRRFGVELEINAFDGRSRPFDYELGNLPKGIFYVSWLVQKLPKIRCLFKSGEIITIMILGF